LIDIATKPNLAVAVGDPLSVGMAQMFDGEAFGDHGLAVVIRTGKQQAAWAQGRWSLQQLSHRIMRNDGNRMPNPAWCPDMCNSGGNIGFQKR
jgi:hypothetical protein